MNKNIKVTKKYWYEIWYEECILCGRENNCKERKYTLKPEKYEDRVHFSQYCCYNCQW